MIYHHIFEKYGNKEVVRAAIIGAGHFGTAVVTQQLHVSGFSVPIVADRNLESARGAFLKAGVADERIKYSADSDEMRSLLLSGFYIYTDSVESIMGIPEIDIICEGTGVPESAANHCKMAIDSGKHIAIISKELDSVIGPQLKKMAKERGLVYTPVDGDQHGLLIQMVEWAKEIGLTVITAGKSRDGEFILDEANNTVSIAADGITVHESVSVKISDTDKTYLQMIPEGCAREYLDRRAEILSSLPNAGGFDLCELTIMANSTGMKPYTPSLTQGTLRITELPVAYCSSTNGGIYENTEGIIDVHTCLRRSDESGMGGGVFMVVRCDNAYSNYILTTKGQIPNYDLSTAVIYRPYHLCGVEVTTSLKTAVLLGLDTGSKDYRQDYDLVRIAARDIEAGEVFGNDHDVKLTSNIVPSTVYGKDNAVPAHMLNGHTARMSIKKGSTITYDMVNEPSHSLLWELRKAQEVSS
ncbi:SAF domain-containing protein [Youngiibacter fragilis]|uniref:Flagellar protein FlgA n=1 Tax=Youngiibacter fragilis 232.1 TaxID=994573 RepID=V7I7M2_9CLOT|nr:SAF domain-containing protein [Youngiibacter fragilis]ETA81271.1 flagellar protein FlgA [Youngiibacter fragilis 232.1]